MRGPSRSSGPPEPHLLDRGQPGHGSRRPAGLLDPPAVRPRGQAEPARAPRPERSQIGPPAWPAPRDHLIPGGLGAAPARAGASLCAMETLENKLALVTGASSGIGAATARALRAEGCHLVLAARRLDALEALAEELGECQVLQLDVRDADAVLEQLGPLPIDICVANAGLGIGMETIQEGDPAEWALMIDTNVKGLLHTVRAVTPGMIERGRGDVVLIGSVAGRQVYPKGNVYCASKWAVRAIYESLREDLPHPELRVSTVDPGMVRTDFSRVRFRGDEAAAAKVYENVDYLTPEDVADAVRYIVTRPPHVNIGELVLWASAQGSTTNLTRKS